MDFYSVLFFSWFWFVLLCLLCAVIVFVCSFFSFLISINRKYFHEAPEFTTHLRRSTFVHKHFVDECIISLYINVFSLWKIKIDAEKHMHQQNKTMHNETNVQHFQKVVYWTTDNLLCMLQSSDFIGYSNYNISYALSFCDIALACAVCVWECWLVVHLIHVCRCKFVSFSKWKTFHHNTLPSPCAAVGHPPALQPVNRITDSYKRKNNTDSFKT